jgi:hypothetical protein
MPRKYPVYLSQESIDQWVPALLAYQHATDVLSHDPTRDQAYRMATEIRRQCCDRSGADDPFPELPHIPAIPLCARRKQRRRFGAHHVPADLRELIAAVRACIPDDSPIRERELRALLSDMDAVTAEAKRADERRYQNESEAA